MKLVASVRSLSSRWVAWAFSAAYLVVSAAVGVVLLSMPKTDAQGAESPATYVSSSDGSSPTVESSAPPSGFRRVSGPEGLSTVIPDGWRTVRAGGPGALRAFDPAEPGRIVGFGGAPAPAEDIVRVHLASETSFAARTAEYRRIDLNSATYGGHPAVEWEFRHRDGGGVRRVHALYWRVAGVEYFVSASAPDAQWARMTPVYDAMIAGSRP